MLNAAIAVLVGLPACGKSSLCDQLIRSSDYKLIWINFDELLDDFSDRIFTEVGGWKKWRVSVLHSIEKYLAFLLDRQDSNELSEESHAVFSRLPKLNTPSQSDFLLLLDDNFYLSSMRHAYFLLAKQYCVGFGIIACQCPITICLDRNRRRAHSVSADVIVRMNGKVEWPDAKNRPWEHHSIILDTSAPLSDSSFSCLGKFLHRLIRAPYDNSAELARLHQSSEDRMINSQSILHALDRFLRRAVRDILSLADSDFKIKHANALSKARLEALRTFKSEMGGAQMQEFTSAHERRILELFRQRIKDCIPDLMEPIRETSSSS